MAGEIGYYWGHRWSHEIPFLWGFHSIHHSAEEIDFLVNTRAHPLDMVFSRFCGLVPIYVLGLGGPVGPAGSVVPVLVTLIGTVWGFFIHANLRWRFGPLEWLISTPAFHHWHHTRTGPINRNYSSTLPWLDRIFGTHYLPRSEWPEAYGIKAKLPDTLRRATGLSAASRARATGCQRQPAGGGRNGPVRRLDRPISNQLARPGARSAPRQRAIGPSRTRTP